MASVSVPLLRSLEAAQSAPSKAIPNKKFSWKVTSFDGWNNTSLGLSLSRDELSSVPKSILKEIYAGFNRIIKASGAQIPDDADSVQFHVDDHHIVLKTGAGVEIEQIPIAADLKLQSALGKVVDRARVYFPASFNADRTIETATAAIKAKPIPKDGFFNLGVATDVNSVARNTVTCLGGLASKLTGTVGASGVVGGLSSAYIGKKIVQEGYQNYRKATACHDTEGRVDGVLSAGIGASFGAVGTAMVAGFLPTVIPQLKAGLATMPTVGQAMACAGNVGVLLMAGFMLVNTSYNWHHLSKFRDELVGIIDDPTLSNEVKSAQGLAFLSQQIYVTEGEMLELQDLHGDDFASLKTAIQNKAEEKWARFVRRVGEDCAIKMANQIDSIQKGLKLGDKDAVLKAVGLLHEVDKASYSVRTKQAIMILLSLLYLAVGILSFITPFGIAVNILFAAGALIFTMIDSKKVAGWITESIYNLRSAPKERWGGALTATSYSDMQTGTQWHLSLLKMNLNDAFDKAKEIRLKLIEKGGVEIEIGKIRSFGHLCKWLRLDEQSFDKESVEISELSFEQLRALRCMEGILLAILKVDQQNLAAKFQAELAALEVDLSMLPQEPEPATETEMIFDVVFNEDPAMELGSVVLVAGHGLQSQLDDAV